MREDILILAGGKGTRLGRLTEHTPKPMIEFNGRPFLFHLIQYLKLFGYRNITISAGYKSAVIQSYFERADPMISIITEEDLLGTGGAVKHYLSKNYSAGQLIVMNGDSFVFDDPNLFANMDNRDCIFGVYVSDRSRYGAIIARNMVVEELREKTERGSGLISAGIYYFKDKKFLKNQMKRYPDKFSLESFMMDYVTKNRVYVSASNGQLIDMGTPEGLSMMGNRIDA